MARSAVSAAAAVATADSEFAEIIDWYHDLLERTYPPAGLLWEPVRVGPTWQWDDGWVLPQFTLGWRVLAWCGVWLRDKHGRPWQFTPEQARFVLWYFSVDETGGFLYHSAVLQRLKGWGKDPLAACLAVAALFAEVTFDHWDGDVPVGREEPAAWVQVVAVTQEQTKTTMALMPSLISPEARRRYGIQVGRLGVHALGDTRTIQAVTSNPDSIEGPRPTLVIRNETQNWKSSNSGHAMAGAIDGNAAKSEGGAARMLDICNAYRPDEDSVGQRAREGWEKTLGIRCDAHAADQDWPSQCESCSLPAVAEFGLLYDSLEAPPEAPLSLDAAPSVVEAIRGDSVWLNVKRILGSISNPVNAASESRRKWYNQITASEEALFDPNRVKLCSVPDELQPGDEVVLFGDGSKSDDATGLLAVRMSDGLAQVLHVQHPKPKEIVNRAAVDLAVTQAFEKYKVVAFFFDPSHAKDDDAEGDARFWWPLVDDWAKRYGARLKHWAVKTGNRQHAVAFDMSSPANQALFVPAVEQLTSDIENSSKEQQLFRFHASTWLQTHLINARRAPAKFGVSMRKEHRESAKKIDLAVCAAGGRMLWRQVQMARVGKRTPGKGRVIVMP